MFGATMAAKGVSIVEPAIQHCMESGLTKRKQLHIVVAFRETGTMEDILYQRSYGGIEPTFEGPYVKIAQAKTLLSLRTGLPTSEVQALRPDLLLPGDTKYWGSAVRGRIVVGASGVQSHYDELFSGWVADACVALIKDWRKGLEDQEEDFI